MLKVDKYVRKTKTFLKKDSRQIKKAAKSKYAKDKRILAASIGVIVLVVFWVLPAFAAKAPGQLGYGIKRGEEWIAANLAPFGSWREALRLDFANQRVVEAAYVADQANQNVHNNEAKTAALSTSC